MSTFKLERTWAKGNGQPATAGRLRISIGDRVVSKFESDVEPGGDTLELPLYFLAEWLAENWWPLLWEPRKREDEELGDFSCRHSILHAQHGFALPAVSFVPQGERLVVHAAPREVTFADVRFPVGGHLILPRKDVEGELRKFVAGVVTRLEERSCKGLDLQHEWSLIEETTEEEAPFCRLMGALGLSPYAEANNRVAATLEAAADRMADTFLLDLCQASTPEAFEANVRLADKAAELTAQAPESTLEPLSSRSPPVDVVTAPAWRHGVNAVRAARTALAINEADPAGGTKFLETLGIDVGASGHPSKADDEEFAIVGAVERDERRSRIALLQSTTPQRRFTAARAAFLGWTAERPQATRLVTLAVTREQQASRAFAAEMMAPIAQIRRLAKRGHIEREDAYALASTLGVSPGLVTKQAANNGLRIGRF